MYADTCCNLIYFCSLYLSYVGLELLSLVHTCRTAQLPTSGVMRRTHTDQQGKRDWNQRDFSFKRKHFFCSSLRESFEGCLTTDVSLPVYAISHERLLSKNASKSDAKLRASFLSSSVEFSGPKNQPNWTLEKKLPAVFFFFFFLLLWIRHDIFSRKVAFSHFTNDAAKGLLSFKLNYSGFYRISGDSCFPKSWKKHVAHPRASVGGVTFWR